MKQILAVLLLLSICSHVYSQKLLRKRKPFYTDIGVFMGGSYYNGDINPTRHFPLESTHLALGLVARKNLNSRWALRASVLYGNLSADDQDSDNQFQQTRNLDFYSSIFEASTTIEFNFLKYYPFDPFGYFRHPTYFTPYTFIGLGVFRFNPKTNLAGNTYELHAVQTEGESYSRTSISVPFGMGIKLRISERLLFSAEWGLRRTFTDYIDDVSGKYPNSPEGLSRIGQELSDRSLEQNAPDGTNWGTQRGNSQTRDWYSFAGLMLTFNITTNPDRCHFEQDK